MPYYINHALVATGILFTVYVISRFLGFHRKTDIRRLRVISGALAGGMFYLGREIAQWEDYHYFDWPGLVAPTIVMIVISVISFNKPES